MNTWISLLRGVNVGGRNILPMKELRKLLEELGYGKVRTYIQSGNCIFESGKRNAANISKDIGQSVFNEFGFKPSVVTISAEQLRIAIQQCPYDALVHEPKSIHYFFLSERPKKADGDALQNLKHPSEQYTIGTDVFYLFAPEGIARSKLAAGAEAKLGVPTTARNYRTVAKLEELCRQA